MEKEKNQLQKQVAQLEQDLFGMGEELSIKDQQLKSAKMAIQKLKGEASSHLEVAQKEIAGLQNEVNKMLKVQTQLENEVSTFGLSMFSGVRIYISVYYADVILIEKNTTT